MTPPSRFRVRCSAMPSASDRPTPPRPRCDPASACSLISSSAFFFRFTNELNDLHTSILAGKEEAAVDGFARFVIACRERARARRVLNRSRMRLAVRSARIACRSHGSILPSPRVMRISDIENRRNRPCSRVMSTFSEGFSRLVSCPAQLHLSLNWHFTEAVSNVVPIKRRFT